MKTFQVQMPLPARGPVGGSGEVEPAAHGGRSGEGACFARLLPVESPPNADGQTADESATAASEPVGESEHAPDEQNVSMTVAATTAVAAWVVDGPLMAPDEGTVQTALAPSETGMASPQVLFGETTAPPVGRTQPVGRPVLVSAAHGEAEPIVARPPEAASAVPARDAWRRDETLLGNHGTKLLAKVEPWADAGGTGRALDGNAMKPAVGAEELAGKVEQELPTRQRLPVGGAAGPLIAESYRQAGRVTGAKVPTVAETATAAGSAVVAEPIHGGAVAVRGSGDATPVREVDRLRTEIWQQVVSFRRLGATETEVRVQPDPRTELRLELRWQGDQVQMVARLERGDFDVLHRHWGTLQETLAAQGVRLSALQPAGGSDALSASGDGGRGGRYDGAGTREQWARGEGVPFEEPVVEPGPTRRGTVRSAGRGWEQWA